MIHAIIFDADGMLIKSERTSDRLVEEYKLDPERIAPFFRTVFQDCLIGKADLKEELAKVLPLWGVPLSVDEMLTFWFDPAHNSIDTRFIPVITALREHGVKCYLATNNEKYRVEDLITNKGMGVIFDSVFASSTYSTKKPEHAFFHYIAEAIACAPEEIAFFDDDPDNLPAAERFGFITHHYSTFETFMRDIENLGLL